MPGKRAPGRLYVVATPIGNLGDLSPRAAEVLAEVDLIAAEDTRVTGRLLKAAGISAKMLSYRDQNEARLAPELLTRLLEGDDIALVCDAGTPTIADPGYRLVNIAGSGGEIEVIAVPGPCAATALLSVSGLPTDRFTVEGFLPARGNARKHALARVAASDCTTVVYESPHRILRLLRELAEDYSDPSVAVGRELTKLHEEVLRGKASEVAERLSEKPPKGEFVVAVYYDGRSERQGLHGGALERLVAKRMNEGSSMRDIAAELKDLGVSRREVYAAGRSIKSKR